MAGASAHGPCAAARATVGGMNRREINLGYMSMRHAPLPERAAFAATVGRWGITPQTRVVCYDAQGGPYAARAWWLLRWLGHDAVAVLDGGPASFVAAGGRLDATPAAATAGAPYPDDRARPPPMPVVDADALAGALFGATPPRALVLDARALERFRGEVEPLDPIAGHIPGAAHRFFKDNLEPDGRFRPVAELRAAFRALGCAPGEIVHQCGSGVTACHNLLAMEHAGLAGSRLYPGSWSEWCADPARPVARG